MPHELYREILIDHYRHPRHNQLLDTPTHRADTANRSCGDRAQVTFSVEGNTVTDVGISIEGCSLAVAGGSVLAEAIFGKKLTDVEQLNGQRVFDLLGGIAPNPSRARCATLALEALHSALGTQAVAATE